MAHATPSNLIQFFDLNTVLDLLSDTGKPLVSSELAADTTALKLLSAAAGRVKSALLVGNIYSTDDLSDLTNDSESLLHELECKIAMIMLVRRRPEKYGSEYWQAIEQEVEEYLDRLRKGERLFDVETAKNAGTPTIDGPTATDYSRLNLIPDRVKNFYPSRASRLPLGRS